MKGKKVERVELTKEQKDEIAIARSVCEQLGLPIFFGWSAENNCIIADDSTDDGVLYGVEFYERILDDTLTPEMEKKIFDNDSVHFDTMNEFRKMAEKNGYKFKS